MAVSEVARSLGMSASGVRWAAERGDLAVAARTPGGMRLFSESDVEVYRQRRSANRTA
jgi:DNA-binding transcriptional MerR regulator